MARVMGARQHGGGRGVNAGALRPSSRGGRGGGTRSAEPWPGASKPAAAGHLWAMTTVLTVLVVLAMLGTAGVLFAGLIGLARGGGDPARSNALMRWRVVLQAVALALFALLLLLLGR